MFKRLDLNQVDMIDLEGKVSAMRVGLSGIVNSANSFAAHRMVASRTD